MTSNEKSTSNEKVRWISAAPNNSTANGRDRSNDSPRLEEISYGHYLEARRLGA